MATAVSQMEKWLSKKEAAQRLQISTRQIERLAEAGRIQKRYAKPGGGKRYGGMHYLESSLMAIEAEREQGIHMTGLSKRPADSVALVATTANSKQAEAWGALVTRLEERPPVDAWERFAKKAWLTLDEAAEYSGLTSAELERLLRQGLIYSFGRGPKTWRIQRESLDAFGKTAHQ